MPINVYIGSNINPVKLIIEEPEINTYIIMRMINKRLDMSNDAFVILSIPFPPKRDTLLKQALIYP